MDSRYFTDNPMTVEDNIGIDESCAQGKDLKKQEKQVKKAKEAALYSKICVQEVMNNKMGRHFVWEELTKCGVYQEGFNADPYVHARNAGLKSAGLQLLDKILKDCPERYQLMFAEHEEKE